jgi:hypothetical protein
MARQVDDGRRSRTVGDVRECRLEVERTARQECARRRMCMDGSDPHREASILTALRNGEISRPEDIDLQVAAREVVAEARDLRAESVRGDPCRKRCTRTFTVA